MTAKPQSPTRDYTVGALTPEAFLAMNMFIVRHLVRLYAAFDGDLVGAIVLGEVAHHNLSAYVADAATARRTNVSAATPVPSPDDYLPTNAFSIAQATGIPRQTVRRKVKSLVERGWLIEDRRGLVVSRVPFDHFSALNAALAADVMETLNVVLTLTRPSSGKR